jgi:hypothetical protein
VPNNDWKDDANNKKLNSGEGDTPVFKNHDLLAGTNPMKIFAKEVAFTICLYTMYRNTRVCIKNKNYVAAFIRFFEGFLNSLAFTFQCSFPFLVLATCFYFPSCY